MRRQHGLLVRIQGASVGGFRFQAVAQAVHQDGGSHADVEAFRKPMHRDFDKDICMVHHEFGCPRKFRAHDQGERTIKGKGFRREPLGMGRRHHQADALRLDRLDASDARVLGLEVSVQIQPLRGAFGHALVAGPGIFAFDQVDVKQAQAIGAAHDGTGVAALVDVFKDHGQVPAASGDHRVKFVQPGLRHQGAKHLGACSGMNHVGVGGQGVRHVANVGTKKVPSPRRGDLCGWLI